MATTRLIPLHTGKGRSVAEALVRSTDYIENPDKTAGGEWISAYECDPVSVDAEFLYSKRQYASLTGRSQGGRDVIAYHLRQSFKPGEVDPAAANKIGYELAMSLTKGRHAFIVCTHVDKAHVHSHIIFNSTSLDCSRKFKNFWNSSFAIRRISDRLCAERGLSVIENPKPSRGSYGTWLGEEKQPSHREKLRDLIDANLSAGLTFAAFLDALKAAGCAVKKHRALSDKTKANSERMKEISELQKHIGAYGKTKDVYAQFVWGGRKESFYEANRASLILHEAAKRYFDDCGFGRDRKIPGMEMLRREYAAFAAENKKLYPDQKRARSEMIELLTAQSNTARILGGPPKEKTRGKEQEESL